MTDGIELDLEKTIGWTAEAIVAGRYRINRVIGAGGMGVVALADDIFLRKPVALKALLPEIAAVPEHVERFRREVALAHSVTHPNIARTHDLGADGHVPFFSMELLKGEPLDKRLERKGKLSVEETRRIGRLICSALRAAHKAGVIHRDLKPANVMLVDDARDVVVMDFGISGFTRDENAEEARAISRELEVAGKTRDSKDAGETDWSVTSAGMGTPQFMPPEQWRNKPIGPPTDLYALGAIMFQCLTGRRVFEADSLMALMHGHLKERAPRVRSVDSSLPKDLDIAIARALEKEPAARFQSAGEMAEAIAGPHGFGRWLGVAAKALVTAGVLAAMAFGILSYQQAWIVEEMRPAVSRLAELTAMRISPDSLAEIRSVHDMESPAFRQLRDELRVVSANNPEIRYLYILRALEDEGEWEFVVDKDPVPGEPLDDGQLAGDEVMGSPPGEVYDGSHIPGMTMALELGRPTSDQEFISDAWGMTLSGYAPIGDMHGPGGYIIGADVDNSSMVLFRKFVFGVCLAAWLVLLGLFVWVERRRAKKEG